MIARMGLIAASPGLFYEGWCRMETAYVSSTATMDLCKGRHQLKKNVFFWALPESPKPPPP